jgi:hypothetical protein
MFSIFKLPFFQNSNPFDPNSNLNDAQLLHAKQNTRAHNITKENMRRLECIKHLFIYFKKSRVLFIYKK